jgi:hypothetical protein
MGMSLDACVVEAPQRPALVREESVEADAHGGLPASRRENIGLGQRGLLQDRHDVVPFVWKVGLENRAGMMAFLDNVSAPDCIALEMSSRPNERPPVYDPSI